MKKNEAAKLIFTIKSMYPNFMKDASQDEMDMAVETWAAMCDYDFGDMMLAIKTFSNTSGSAFAPSIAQLIACVQKTTDTPQLDEAQAWALVDRAIRNSTYNYKEEFDKLPDLVKSAVGSAQMLHSWASTDMKTIDTIVASNFQRAYRTIASREREVSHMPVEARMRLQDITESVLALEGGKNE